MGITQKNFNDLLDEKIDVITMGNHTWGKKDIFKFIDHPKLLRPANYPKGVVGKGYSIYECGNKKIGVINLIGRVDINVLSENPFIIGKEINTAAKIIYTPIENLSSTFFFKNIHHITAVSIITLAATKSNQNGINSVIFKI